jgi:hypothetical protein
VRPPEGVAKNRFERFGRQRFDSPREIREFARSRDDM